MSEIAIALTLQLIWNILTVKGMWICAPWNSITFRTHFLLCSWVLMPVHFTRGSYKISLKLSSWWEEISDYDAYFGVVKLNEEKFSDFVMHELVHCVNSYPEPRSVLALDNIKFNQNKKFLDTISEIGALCAYLPHYGPFHNWTEHVFRDIKCIEVTKGFCREKLLQHVENYWLHLRISSDCKFQC